MASIGTASATEELPPLINSNAPSPPEDEDMLPLTDSDAEYEAPATWGEAREWIKSAYKRQERGIRSEFVQQRKHTDEQFVELRSHVDGKFAHIDAKFTHIDAKFDGKFSLLQGRLDITQAQQRNYQACDGTTSLTPVAYYDPISNTILQPPPSFPKRVFDFWFLQSTGRQQLCELLAFYRTKGWERWGLDGPVADDCPSHTSLFEAVHDWPEIALKELATHLGLLFERVKRNVPEAIERWRRQQAEYASMPLPKRQATPEGEEQVVYKRVRQPLGRATNDTTGAQPPHDHDDIPEKSEVRYVQHTLVPEPEPSEFLYYRRGYTTPSDTPLQRDVFGREIPRAVLIPGQAVPSSKVLPSRNLGSGDQAEGGGHALQSPAPLQEQSIQRYGQRSSHGASSRGPEAALAPSESTRSHQTEAYVEDLLDESHSQGSRSKRRQARQVSEPPAAVIPRPLKTSSRDTKCRSRDASDSRPPKKSSSHTSAHSKRQTRRQSEPPVPLGAVDVHTPMDAADVPTPAKGMYSSTPAAAVEMPSTAEDALNSGVAPSPWRRTEFVIPPVGLSGETVEDSSDEAAEMLARATTFKR